MGRGEEPPAPRQDTPTDGLQAEDHELKLTYRAKSSQGVRMTAGPNALATLPEMLADVSQGRVTVVPPLDSSIHTASPNLLRPEEAEAWLHATRDQPPDIRHGLIILASLDALDPAFETSALAQLSGETDTSGLPRVRRDRGWRRVALGRADRRHDRAWGGRLGRTRRPR